MKILVISRNAWDDTNSIGNTLSNFFSGIENAEFANIYFRSSKPNNSLCKRYYRITEKDVLRNWFSPKKIGKTFEIYTKDQADDKVSKEEKRLISYIHKYNLRFAHRISNMLFNSQKWINEKLDKFISDFDPDIVFSFAKSSPQYYLTIRHLKEAFGLKTILWIADDEYTSLSQKKDRASQKDLQRLEYVISAGNKVYGCSEAICSYYNSIFNCNSVPHYKYCRFDYPVRTNVNDPIRIVYAGNLLFGREDMLYAIVKQLAKVNKTEQNFFLDIYSNTFVSEEQKQKLTVTGVSRFSGQKSYEEIKRIFSDSDILLLIESFSPTEIIKTRYSFSTKIIDCLQSGSSILAIGPSNISTIKYVESIPGAFVLNDIDGLEQYLENIADAPDLLVNNAKAIRSFALRNHSPDNKWLDV